jgi:hypothetical protein
LYDPGIQNGWIRKISSTILPERNEGYFDGSSGSGKLRFNFPDIFFDIVFFKTSLERHTVNGSLEKLGCIVFRPGFLVYFIGNFECGTWLPQI